MYNAPAVHFPVGRSTFQAWLLLLLWAIGGIAVVYGASLSGQPGWMLPAAVSLTVISAGTAWIYWRRSPVGILRWDGKQWTFSAAPADVATTLVGVSVNLDFQLVMLVNFRVEAGQPLWIWLERQAEPRRWRLLRRALHARPRQTALRAAYDPLESSTA